MPLRDEGSSNTEAPAALGLRRHDLYLLLAVIALSIVGTRIATAPDSFSPNDRSRWATIRAIVDTGSYAIGRREMFSDGRYRDVGIMSQNGWDTIDIVLHPETLQFYSTKPTLLPTVLAAEYWILRHALNLRFVRARTTITRTILFTINGLPFVLYLCVFVRLAERLGTTDWGRLFVFAAAAFGTFVSGYLGSLNNHTVAAMSVLFAVYQCLCIDLDRDRRWWRFALAGLCLGWAVCNELPSAALTAALTLWLARLSLRDTLGWTLPALMLPLAAYALTQYLAIGTVAPTYAQASWYEYPGSYWSAPTGIDAINEPKHVYAAHLLIGHTGILSLTPVLVLGWIGMIRTARRPHGETPRDVAARVLAAITLALTVLVFAFYVFRTEGYGGVTAGPRWFFWLVPLWLLTALAEADRWASDGRLRRLALVFLAFSIATASFALAHPWQSSPLLILFRRLGIVSY